MRSGMWILTVTTIVGLVCAGNAADNETDDQSSVNQKRSSQKSRRNRAVRRYSRDRKTGTKNYRELFEEDALKQKTIQAGASLADTEEEAVRHADHQSDSKSERDNDVRRISGHGKQTKRRNIFNSDYRSTSKKRRAIRRIRSVESPDSVPSLDVENTTEESVAKTNPARSITQQSGTAVVSLKWKLHGDINVGQECECSLIVANTSGVAAKDVIVEASFPSSVRLLSAKPEPSESIERLVWEFTELAAGSKTDIRIRLIPSVPGELATSANVRFTGISTASFQVEEPKLLVTIKGPETAVVGDSATQMVTISNPGTGVAQNVVLEAVIPEGLEHAKGRELSIGVGSLGPGESRSIRLALAAVGGGDHIVLVNAHGAASLRQRAASRINVIAPSLDIAITGPKLRYINRRGKYQVKVTNDGGASSDNVRVYHELPEGFEFVKASNGGKSDSSGRGVTWYVGHLDAGQSVQLNVELIPKTIGDYSHHVRVTADEGSHQEARLQTKVEGSAALVLVLDDRDDPIETGSETWIEARVENRGTKAAANMGISIELPTGIELLDAKGPSDFIAENGLLVFKSIDQLKPKEIVTYRLHVIGREAGNRRFRARLTSDSIQQPLIVEELTRFYGE